MLDKWQWRATEKNEEKKSTMISEWTFGDTVIEPYLEKCGLLGSQNNPGLCAPSEY